MASIHELQEHIGSVRDTMKITNAMYMISNNKMRKAKKAWEETKPYFDTLQDVLALTIQHMPSVDLPYFDRRLNLSKEKRMTGYIVITGDKGLAGAYHQNIYKVADQAMAETPNYSLFIIGQMGTHHYHEKGVMIDASFMYTAQNPTLARARSIGTRIVEMFMNGMLDDVYVIFTEMINSMSMEVKKLQLLPLRKEELRMNREPEQEYTLYPTPWDVFTTVLPDYVVGTLYGAMVESYCCEQNARVIAMENATDSAKDILADLELEYNRQRQANITQEITEIIGGARAQKGK